MKVKDIMTTSVLSVKESQYLNDAACLMWEFDFGSLPVLDEDECIQGVVTDRDICMAAYTKGLPIENISVRTAMSTIIYSCSEDDSIEKAEDLMRRHQVRRLPVLDKNKKLKGILSLNDIVLAYNNHSLASSIKATDIAKTLGSVSEHRHGSLMSIAS
jgi:CBS domain-containing protein